MTGHEVDTLLGLASLVSVNLRTAEQPVGERPDRAGVAAEESANVIAETSVPFFPTVAHEAADLIEPGRIPGFGDQLGPRQRRVRLDVPEHRRVLYGVALRV